jgi:hypothetical protein
MVTFESDKEVIKLDAESHIGLISYLYSGDLGRAIHTIEAIDS